jgi:hypothetical protein
MKNLLICGMLLFSGAAAAQDRPSCLHSCDDPYSTCRQMCPNRRPECPAQCARQRIDCKRQCILQFSKPLPPKSDVINGRPLTQKGPLWRQQKP